VPEVNVEFPQTQDNVWEDLQFQFNGSWMPSVDGALIGPENYQTLQNLRYKDVGLEGVGGYTKINTTALTNYTNIRTGIQLRSEKTQSTYTLVQAQYPGAGSDQGRVYCNRTAIGSQGDFDTSAKFDTSGNSYFADASVALTGRFSHAPQGNVAYCNNEESMIFGGDETHCAAIFATDTTCTTIANKQAANPTDLTEELGNTLSTASERYQWQQADQPYMVIMTTRPIQTLKFYVHTANEVAGLMTIKAWNGTAWTADLVDTDNTIAVAGKTLGQTGTIELSSHTDGTAVPFHFEELYLYAYLCEIAAGVDAVVYHITADFAFQSIKDVWDGVYRQPIQVQMYDSAGTNFEDFTLQVQESSDVDLPIGLILNGLLDDEDDYVYVMFEEPMAAIKFTMLGDMVNSTALTTMLCKYWDGDAWTAVSDLQDGTEGTVSMDQTGLVTWTAPTDEQPRTLFGSYGYVYRFYWDENISGAKDSDPPTVVVDLITGVPQQKIVKGFDFSTLYKNRLMLGAYTAGNEGNRMDYSVANAPDAWNGLDASDDGVGSLYFGGIEPIIAAEQLYNRFGANVFAMLLVLKKTETYLMVGDTPDEFKIYPVSLSLGCAAAQTLAVAETGMEVGEGMNRNAAIWLSNSGPVMFDGAVLQPIRGIEKYFDPKESDYLSWTYINQARAWVDPIYKEYNLLIPTGSNTTNNKWLVYDLVRKKWYEKSTGTADTPQCGFNVTTTNGEIRTYGGIDTGFMLYLENGNHWNTVAIDMRLKTGDFFPSQNIWDYTRIRKFKILMKKLSTDSTAPSLELHYYADTGEESGVGLVWEDENVTTGIDFDFEDWADFEWDSAASSTFDLTADVGLARLIRGNADMNQLGYAHAFEFRLATDDVTKGFQPVAWGVRYRVERKDDTAS
jgi:hypothetical protein